MNRLVLRRHGVLGRGEEGVGRIASSRFRSSYLSSGIRILAANVSFISVLMPIVK